MWDFLEGLLDTTGFTPLRESGGWSQDLILVHNVSDFSIWVACIAIPGVLVFFVRRRRDMPFPHMFWILGGFILSSGFVHFLEVHTFYTPVYRLMGLVKAITAAAAWVTAVALIPVAPKLLAMRFPEELEQEIERRKQTEELWESSREGLRRQTEVLRSILNSMGDGVVVADQDGQLVLTNPAAKRLLGAYPLGLPPVENENGYGAFLPDKVTPCPPDQLPLSRAIRGEIVNRAQLFVRHSGAPQGSWISVTGCPLRGEKEELHGGVVVLRDITERKSAEEEIQKRQKQLADAQQLAHLGSWEWDIATNRVLWSDELYRLFGRDPQEFDTTYDTLIERIHAEDRSRVRRLMERAYRKGTPFNEYVRVSAADGTLRLLHCRVQVLMDDEGHPVRLLGICQDVTEARRQKQTLEDTNRTLTALLDASPVGIFVIDEQAKVTTLWNRAAERIFGWREDEVKGRRLPIVPDASRAEFRAFLKRAFAGEELSGVEVRRRRKDGSLIDISVYTAPLRGPDGNIDRIMAAVADISDRKRAEQKSGASELLFRSVWENSVDAMQLTDANGIIVAANSAYCGLVEMEPRELVGKSIAVAYPEAMRNRAMVQYRERFTRRSVGRRVLTRLAFRSGKSCDVEVAYSFVEFASRSPLLLSVLRDVSDRTRAEQEVRRSQQLLAIAQEIAHVGSWEWEIASNRIAWSDELYHIFGLGKSEFEPTFEAFLERVHPADRQRVKHAVETTSRTRRPFELEERVVRPDGVVRTLHVRGQILATEDDTVLRMIGTCQDITDAKQREEALRESEERFRFLVEGVKDYAIFMLGPAGNVASWNAGAERIEGYRGEEILGQHFSRFYLEHDIDVGTPERHLRLAQGQGKCENEGWRVRKDGSRYWATVLMTALRDGSGQTYGFVKLVRDTTEIREAQERAMRAERLAAIGEMIAGLAHESRNALQRSKACLERLAWRCEDRPDALELICRIQQAQRDLHHTYEEVRHYAAPVRLDCETHDIGMLIKQTWDELAEFHAKRHGRLRDFAKGLDLRCEVDPLAIKQVFRNILENSLAACGDPVEIAVECQAILLGENPALEISIRDNGPGLTSEQRDRLFEPFYTTKTRGTGLGMAIAKRIVESHGGKIVAGRSDQTGAEIIVKLLRRQS